MLHERDEAHRTSFEQMGGRDAVSLILVWIMLSLTWVHRKRSGAPVCFSVLRLHDYWQTDRIAGLNIAIRLAHSTRQCVASQRAATEQWRSAAVGEAGWIIVQNITQRAWGDGIRHQLALARFHLRLASPTLAATGGRPVRARGGHEARASAAVRQAAAHGTVCSRVMAALVVLVRLSHLPRLYDRTGGDGWLLGPRPSWSHPAPYAYQVHRRRVHRTGHVRGVAMDALPSPRVRLLVRQLALTCRAPCRLRPPQSS